ncbi:MAG: hypothetical protein HFH71_05010 [Clostridia bacterium]|nr:hypothetical protein [Clostridia bacterium]
MREHKRWQIAVAFVFGVACVVGPILLVVVSRALGAFKSTYYMYLALIALGVFSVARGFIFVTHNRRLKRLSERGERIKARYVSHGTERQEGRMPVYYIRYTFEAAGKTFNAKSPAEYSWEQALAFRAAEEFDILYCDGDYTVADGGAEMYSRYFDRVQELKRAYNEAFYKVYAGGEDSCAAAANRTGGDTECGEKLSDDDADIDMDSDAPVGSGDISDVDTGDGDDGEKSLLAGAEDKDN